MRPLVAAFTLLAASAASSCALAANPYGVWFGYSENRETVIMTVKGSLGPSIFCRRGELALSVVDQGRRSEQLATGEALVVRFQADSSAPIATTAMARNERSFEIARPHPLVRQIASARRVNFLVTRANGESFRRDYSVVGARNAMTAISKDCPI